MKQRSLRPGLEVPMALGLAVLMVDACGADKPRSANAVVGADAAPETDGGPVVPILPDDAAGPPAPVAAADAGIPCPSGLSCDVACGGSTTTTVSGTVYDPAGKNPLYGVAVYVPATPLAPLPKGVPSGADACSCGALYKSGALTNTTTDVDGTFTLTNVPVGAKVPLVLQVGKWRRRIDIAVEECRDNPQPGTSLAFLGSIAAGDTDDEMPEIAVSTGASDSLECLLRRMGVASSEYVPGAGAPGHVHVFSGGDPVGTSGGGLPEENPMPGAPASDKALWANEDQLLPYDLVLLSCEGGETYDANPAALEAYVNAGGRAFASHFHYAWFAGPIGSAQSYVAPSDWGGNLATWTLDQFGAGSPVGGILVQTLNGSGKPFPKGEALARWLAKTGALGKGVAPGELSIYAPKFNATVTAANPASQPWIDSDATGIDGGTMYFSFDTPVNAPVPADGGAPAYCGRAVFSDLHVAGDPTTYDESPPPEKCATGDLSPQEKALEFMIFDLSSCVVPDTIAVPRDAGLPPPPK